MFHILSTYLYEERCKGFKYFYFIIKFLIEPRIMLSFQMIVFVGSLFTFNNIFAFWYYLYINSMKCSLVIGIHSLQSPCFHNSSRQPYHIRQGKALK